jgi:hypothetical protein
MDDDALRGSFEEASRKLRGSFEEASRELRGAMRF